MSLYGEKKIIIFIVFYLIVGTGNIFSSERSFFKYADMKCGAHVLWLAAQKQGIEVSLAKIDKLLYDDNKYIGANIQKLIEVANVIKLKVDIKKNLVSNDIHKYPAIALLVDNNAHLVFVLDFKKDSVVIADNLEKIILNENELMKRWNGIALVFRDISHNSEAGKNFDVLTPRRISYIIVGFGLILLTVGTIVQRKTKTNT